MENTTALAPAAPAAPVSPFTDFDQENRFDTDFPEIENVRGMEPFIVVADPRVALAAKVSTSFPVADAVAAVLLFVVTPDGSVPTVQVQAVWVIPT